MNRDCAVGDLRREGTAIIQLAGAGDLDAAVPSCPGWTVAALLKHLGNVYNWAGTIVLEQLQDAPHRDRLPRRGDTETDLEWMSHRLDRLVAALDAVPADAVVWNFVTDSPASPEFWWRRQVHETVVHRVDAETARDRPITPVSPDLAADGIAELLEIRHFEVVAPDRFSDAEGLWVHLHATDLEGAEWTIDTGARTVTAAHMKGDVALRGPAWAIMRWLWGRPVGAELEEFGDLEAAAEWRRQALA